MKKVFLLCILCLVCFSLKAQRVSDVYSLKGALGITKFSDLRTSIALNKIIGDSSFFLEGELFYSRFPIKGRKDPFNYRDEIFHKSSLYGLQLEVGWSYEEISPVFLNLKAGGFLGYENINEGSKQGLYGVELPYPINSLVYGVVASPEIEIALGEKISLCFTFSQYMNLGSKYSHYFSSLELGVKYYFN